LVLWGNSNNRRVLEKARAEIARCIASRKIELGELKKETVIHGPRKGQEHPKGPVSGEGVTAWEVVMMTARAEVMNAFLAEHAPPVLDPFCGGGSIPLEAQRLGLRPIASDLNPVAVLITKALIEIPPQFAGRPRSTPTGTRPARPLRPGGVPVDWLRMCATTVGGCAPRRKTHRPPLSHGEDHTGTDQGAPRSPAVRR